MPRPITQTAFIRQATAAVNAAETAVASREALGRFTRRAVTRREKKAVADLEEMVLMRESGGV